MEKKEAYSKLQELVNAAYAALGAAEAFAEEHSLSFGFSPAYGMGGHFYPTTSEDHNSEYADNGWISSSVSC